MGGCAAWGCGGYGGGCGVSQLRVFAELARVSNLPTVWSNVLVGLCAGYVAKRLAEPESRPVTDLDLLLDPAFLLGFGLLCVWGSCFYTAGMVLNDVADARSDAVHRPHRPIPSGRFNRWVALVIVAVLFAAGFAALLPFASDNRGRLLTLASLLAVCIVAYNLLHRRSAFAVLFMGLCRALLVVTAGSVFGVTGRAWWMVVLPIAGALFCYTVAITVIARIEHRASQDARRFLGFVMVPIALSPALFLTQITAARFPAMLAALMVTLWLAGAAAMVMSNPPRTQRAVMTWLSGMCLIDMWFIVLLGRPSVATFAAGCFVLTVLGHRRIMGT